MDGKVLLFISLAVGLALQPCGGTVVRKTKQISLILDQPPFNLSVPNDPSPSIVLESPSAEVSSPSTERPREVTGLPEEDVTEPPETGTPSVFEDESESLFGGTGAGASVGAGSSQSPVPSSSPSSSFGDAFPIFAGGSAPSPGAAVTPDESGSP